MTGTVLSRWQAKLVTRRKLLTAARERYVRHPTSANRATLSLRKRQVAQAEKVIARHRPAGITDGTLAFIAQWEGTYLYAYDDATGLPWGNGPGRSCQGNKTIGTGLTAGEFPDGKVPATITVARNNELFRERLNKVYLPPVLASLKRAGITPTANIVTGLVSASYNLGIGMFQGARGFEHVTAALKTGKLRAVAAALLLYDDPGDPRWHEGLHRRRVAEHDIVLK